MTCKPHFAAKPERAPPSHDSETSLRSEVDEVSPRAFEQVRVWDVRFAGDEELRELTQWMKSHLSNKYPKGVGLLEAYKYALRYVREREDPARRAERRQQRQEKQKSPKKSATKAGKGARKPPKAARTRHIPVKEQDTVWVRDKGQCAFVGPGGRRCNATHNLELDHYPVPYARGGPNKADNLRLLCAKHNRYTAAEVYGERHMARYEVRRQE